MVSVSYRDPQLPRQNKKSRHHKPNPRQDNAIRQQNKTNSRQHTTNSPQNKINSRQYTINSRQNEINSRQITPNSRQNKVNPRQNKENEQVSRRYPPPKWHVMQQQHTARPETAIFSAVFPIPSPRCPAAPVARQSIKTPTPAKTVAKVSFSI